MGWWQYITGITPNAWVAITALGTWVLVVGTLLVVRLLSIPEKRGNLDVMSPPEVLV